jgi:hypothetical protein
LVPSTAVFENRDIPHVQVRGVFFLLWGLMRKVFTAGVVLCALDSAAQAGGPMPLTEMDTVSAGDATASVLMAGTVDGPRAQLQSAIYNVATASPHSSLAQTRAAVLGTGTAGAADIQSQSTTEGARAIATEGGTASGQRALIAGLVVTTATTTTDPIGLRVGIAGGTTYTLSLSLSGP